VFKSALMREDFPVPLAPQSRTLLLGRLFKNLWVFSISTFLCRSIPTRSLNEIFSIYLTGFKCSFFALHIAARSLFHSTFSSIFISPYPKTFEDFFMLNNNTATNARTHPKTVERAICSS